MNFTIRQVAEFVPIWDLLANGNDIGLLTNFPGEGIVFTVKHDDATVTDYSAATLHEAILKAKETFAQLVAGTHESQAYIDEDFIEDEEGEIARMRWEENQAERFTEQHPYDY
ncbi:hypothetical protein vBRpoSV10_2 [Ruegeria phage vB_RpoS-V10]|nr:hypothetical protein vBRpoSV10_2 [Ruegeria phage vB_RpoS-V10]